MYREFVFDWLQDHSPPQPPPTSKLKERIHANREDSGNSGPAMKRKRTGAPCPVSPIVIGDDPSSRGSHGDYDLDLAQPKVEPAEDVDDAQDYTQEKDASESLATLLGGESSHGGIHAESIQGRTLASFPARQGDTITVGSLPSRVGDVFRRHLFV